MTRRRVAEESLDLPECQSPRVGRARRFEASVAVSWETRDGDDAREVRVLNQSMRPGWLEVIEAELRDLSGDAVRIGPLDDGICVYGFVRSYAEKRRAGERVRVLLPEAHVANGLRVARTSHDSQRPL